MLSRTIDGKARLDPNQVDGSPIAPNGNGETIQTSTSSQISLRDVNLCIEFLPSIISFQEQTTKLLKTIQEAREAYMYAQSEGFEYHEPGPKVLKAANADQTSTSRDWGCAMSCALLHNSGLAHSMLYYPAAALQAYMAALSAAQPM